MSGPRPGRSFPLWRRRSPSSGRRGRVVIFVCDAHAPDDREFRYFPAHAVKGSWGARIIPELTPAPGDYQVEKTRYSAFAHTNLDDILKQEQVDAKCTWWG